MSVITKCVVCNRPKDEDEVDVCAQCDQSTCFNCGGGSPCCEEKDETESEE